MKKFFSFLIVLLALFLLVGCGEEQSDVKPTGVSITASKNSVEIGNYLDLKAAVAPKGASQSVTWETSNAEVATVTDKGRVTGVALGSATITATSTVDTSIKGSIAITVVEQGENVSTNVEVTAITLEFNEEVYADFDFKVTATTEPAGETGQITWTSSNEEVATVSKGVIHAIKAGTCEITAKSWSVEEKITITVNERPDLESFVITNLHDIDTNGVDQLGVEAIPRYAKIDIVWSIDDPTVATIDDNGLVKPLKEGEVNVTARDRNTNLEVSGKIRITKAFNPNEVDPSSVTISGETSCYVGYTIRLFAEVLPSGVSQEVTWTVTPEGSATIDENGVLTAVKEGTVRVKATTTGAKKVTSSPFKVVIEKEPEPEPDIDLGGYEIVIMNAQSALTDIDPFLSGYNGVDKTYKQRAWREIESKYNCKITVKAYPEEAPWGPSRVKWIKENAMNNTSQLDFGIIAAAWLTDFVQAGSAVDTTEFFAAFGKKQIEPSLREAGMYHNKLYIVSPGLPETKVYPYKGLFYNVKLLKKYNLESPAKLFNEDRWTYEDFVEYCKQAQSVMGENEYGKEYVLSGAPSILWAGMVNAAGVKLSDKTTITLNFTHTYSLDAAKALREIYSAGAWEPDYIANIDDSVYSFTREGRALFQGGDYWFVRASNRFPADLWGPDTEYGYVPFPYPATVGKANTRVNDIGDSLILMVAGRNYPAGIEARGVYRAVQEMYINTNKYMKEDDTYNPTELKYNAVKSRIDDPESIIATVWFTSSRTIYDPLHEQSFQNEDSSESAIAIRNIVVKGNDAAQEFESIEDAVLAKFRQKYA